jgi:hypothetical protein
MAAAAVMVAAAAARVAAVAVMVTVARGIATSASHSKEFQQHMR